METDYYLSTVTNLQHVNLQQFCIICKGKTVISSFSFVVGGTIADNSTFDTHD